MIGLGSFDFFILFQVCVSGDVEFNREMSFQRVVYPHRGWRELNGACCFGGRSVLRVAWKCAQWIVLRDPQTVAVLPL